MACPKQGRAGRATTEYAAVITDAFRKALDPRHYPGGGSLVWFFVALVLFKIAVARSSVVLVLFATGNL